MRYLFLFGLIVVSVLATLVESANNQQSRSTSNQVNINHHHRNRSVNNQSSSATVQRRSKPVAKPKSIAKSHRNVAKKQQSNKKAKGVLVDRNGKRRRAVVKSKPRRKHVVRAIRKVSRRVNRVKPSNRGKSIKRRSSQQRKRLAKQEEADIEGADQEGFGEEQQSVDSSASPSDTSGSTDTAADQPAVETPSVSTPEETQPAQPDQTNLASPQLPANIPSSFNPSKLNNVSGKNAVGIGYASNSNGPSVAFGYATSINGQNTAGGFGI